MGIKHPECVSVPFISKGLVGGSSLKPLSAGKQEAGIWLHHDMPKEKISINRLAATQPQAWQPQALMCSWPVLIEESHSEKGGELLPSCA